MAYTAQDIMKLREVTGYSAKDCMEAMRAANGDLSKAAAMLLGTGSPPQPSNQGMQERPQKKEANSMRECKLLTFHYETDTRLKDTSTRRELKTFGTYFTESHMQNYNNRLEDHPAWEAELNSYLAAGWTIHSMTSNDRNCSITFLLVR